MKQICHKAVRVCQFSRGDIIFGPGEVPLLPELLIQHEGACFYQHVGDAKHTFMRPISFLNEPALWTAWIYRGTMQCYEDSMIFSLNGDVLAQISENTSYFD